jgi:hypothetical protein
MPLVVEKMNTAERHAEFRTLKLISTITRALAEPEQILSMGSGSRARVVLLQSGRWRRRCRLRGAC